MFMIKLQGFLPFQISIISHCKQSNTSPDPVIGWSFGWDLHVSHEVGGMTCCGELTLSDTSFVEWTIVASSSHIGFDIHWFEMNTWEINDWILMVAIFDAFLAEVPLSSL